MPKITDFTPQQQNANKHTSYGSRLLENSVQEDGWIDGQTTAANGEMISGSSRLELAVEKFPDVEPIVIDSDGTRPIIIRRTDIPTAEAARAKRLSVAANRIAHANYDPDWGVLKEWGEEDNEVKKLFSDEEWREGTGEELATADAEPQIDRAAELQVKWNTASGQLWQLGNHRLLIGDCTEVINVSKLLGGSKVNLVHADPPYGMGKNEIENDNLYVEKLDLFQMQWFNQCRSFIADNSSVYIWGNAEDLWRLWFSKLSKSERMTFRNEIVWDKRDNSNSSLRVNGKTFEGMRSFYNSERVLFFMLGEQGFNNNSDNYWDGWENIRSSLFEDCEKMGWGAKDIERICGVGMYGHWFTKSQWTLIPEEHYKKLQAAAREHDAFKREHDAFKREHDELKREFYNTRSPFNVLPENMTDVWNFPTLQGNDRPDHPTPKPVELMERIFKTSGTDDAVIYSPFLGSGTDIIAGQNCNRIVYGHEKEPNYAAVSLERFSQAFPDEEIRLIE